MTGDSSIRVSNETMAWVKGIKGYLSFITGIEYPNDLVLQIMCGLTDYMLVSGKFPTDSEFRRYVQKRAKQFLEQRKWERMQGKLELMYDANKRPPNVKYYPIEGTKGK
jgi:hypothetical protein